MGFSGSLTKMKIIAYSDDSFQQLRGQMSVYMNPSQYTRQYSICYNTVQAQGSPGGSPRYNKTLPDVVQLQLVFDGTGVVPTAIPGVLPFMSDGIKTQVDKFLGLVFAYNGQIHSPNYLQLSWGTLAFRCRLSDLKLTYTLFKPDGTPLRARADATFKEYTNPKQLAKEANKSSPDLSHIVTVKAGDTLPWLCFTIYGSSVYYIDVARVNGLTDFRRLVPGQQLLFPPLEDSPA